MYPTLENVTACITCRLAGKVSEPASLIAWHQYVVAFLKTIREYDTDAEEVAGYPAVVIVTVLDVVDAVHGSVHSCHKL